ncbi:hypothetical protein TELCIR_04534 [Teladorsagia circumcincta]|uniref:Uncharacterized protein n=1 Tax=Teladorsagia circumcincta TaxID=45464 RepID=A0A2G9UTC4_TELCI|nr:hypothetical protein TELCIR_04534 [Teladorsagia circumcincta]
MWCPGLRSHVCGKRSDLVQELFVAELAKASYTQAVLEKRKTIQTKDIAAEVITEEDLENVEENAAEEDAAVEETVEDAEEDVEETADSDVVEDANT